MRALNYPVDDEEALYGRVVNEKDPPRNGHLQNIQPDINHRYQVYINNIEEVFDQPASGYSQDEQEALSHAWSSPTKSVKQLKKAILDAQTEEFKRVCAYCMIHRRSTFDHYLPQAGYKEFSVLGKNLIPCCGPCNNKKSNHVRDDQAQRAYLHFFVDTIPDVQILFASITMNAGTPVATFTIDNRNGTIDAEYQQAKRHFESLELLKEYEIENSVVLSDCRVDIRANLINSPHMLRDNLRRRALAEQERYGTNYYKSVLLLAYAESNECLMWLIGQ